MKTGNHQCKAKRCRKYTNVYVLYKVSVGAATLQPSGAGDPSTSWLEHQFAIQWIISSSPIQRTVQSQKPGDWLPDILFKPVTSYPIKKLSAAIREEFCYQMFHSNNCQRMFSPGIF